MITFDQARAIAAAKLLPSWNPDAGTFHVADWGWENQEYWCLAVGPAEYLVDGNDDMAADDDRIHLVNKTTGDYVATTAQSNLDLLDSLTIVGAIPDNFQ